MWWNLNNLNGFSLDVHFAVNQLNKFPSTVNCINFHLQFKLSTEVLPYAFQAMIVNAQFLYVNFLIRISKKSKFFAARYADTKKSHLYLVIKSRHRIILKPHSKFSYLSPPMKQISVSFFLQPSHFHHSITYPQMKTEKLKIYNNTGL